MDINNIRRDNQLNVRINDRNNVQLHTNINLGVRPLSTKYAYKPILDRPLSQDVPLQKYPEFNVKRDFLPGNRQGPWDGFATHIHDESLLRNMFFAISKAPQRYYIPSSRSDLYKTAPVRTSNPTKQTHPLLFNASKTSNKVTKVTKPIYKEHKVFNNDSRQMRLNEHR